MLKLGSSLLPLKRWGAVGGLQATECMFSKGMREGVKVTGRMPVWLVRGPESSKLQHTTPIQIQKQTRTTKQPTEEEEWGGEEH